VTEVALVRDPVDPIASSGPVGRAVERLRRALQDRRVPVEVRIATGEPEEDAAVLRISGPTVPSTRRALARAGVSTPAVPEAFAIVRENDPRERLTACGADVRGLVYAVLEIADRVDHGADAREALRLEQALVERPVNTVRSVTRLFCSEVEDLAWYRDEGFWRRYLSMLVAQRFNRFSLTLGLGYNFPRGVTDAYLYFAYPFLVSVRGYEVRVPQVPDEERDRNLAALRFISEEANALGLDFQVGLWTHAYEWIESPDAHQTVEGLTPDIHTAYCRDAVRTLLELCPAIGGLTFRVHGEGGVPEGSWDFWRTVFEGVAGCGRPVGIDLHAKGLDERTLTSALETGLPVTVSPKFWAEHMGLPYHQAAIRESERTPREDPAHLSDWHRYMRVSEGSRPFTRYGYADFLRDDRPYGVVFRLWAGTQRLLLWGDPAFAAGYGRAAGLAGSQGLEWCEPLTFKGREGSGLTGPRTGYADPSLVPSDDWEKYAYTYRLFGRLTYDPDAPAEVWRRALRSDFGSGATDAEAALASASRILPLVTVAHHPSASNNYYWPELYTDMPIVVREDEAQTHPYHDTPVPRRFGTVSPLDPEVFSSVETYVAGLVADAWDGRVSPLDVATCLDRLAHDAIESLAVGAASLTSPEGRRCTVDVRILAALGQFFAAKMRAAVGYEIYRLTGDAASLNLALRDHRAARAAWIEVAKQGHLYVPDLTFGPQPWIRGHWRDRLDPIEVDVRAMEELVREAGGPVSATGVVVAPSSDTPTDVELRHDQPSFRHGSDIPIELEVVGPGSSKVESVRLRYRPMDQSREFEETEMRRDGDHLAAIIPSTSTSAPYPLAYAFLLMDGRGAVWRHPGLGEDLAGCPYFVVEGEAIG
jgi:sugar phosphate isomerase/epimerase